MISKSEILDTQKVIEAHANEMGFDFFPVIYEMVDYDTMSAVAAYGGFPSRYPHWSFGMEYDRLSKSYGYGLSKIYEMVINTDPVYAYLLDSNPMVDQQLVIAHVCGHAHFFKHNFYFSHTNRKMLDEMANHGHRVRRYMAKYGVEVVENFIDCCLTIEDLIDLHSPYIRRHPKLEWHEQSDDGDSNEKPESGVLKLPASGYMEGYINPPEFISAQREQAHKAMQAGLKFPPRPEKDVLLFLLHHAPLEAWQHDVLDIIREEAYYFAPQGQTKIMNEGCACWAHTRLMTQKILQPEDAIDYAEHHSGTVAAHPGRINPYRLGLALLNDIEKRWNKGQFGPEYEACDDWNTRKNWNTNVGLGKEKVFEVWKHYNDVTFIDEFLTPDFVAEHMLFGYEWNDDIEAYQIATRDFAAIKQKLLWGLTNHGRPFIYVTDGNYNNRGELYLTHRHEGMDLKTDEARDTLRNLFMIWKRPVHIETIYDEQKTLLSFDGDNHEERQMMNDE